ncbi:MAG: ABC transporter permease [Armatimonadota bacterium]
MVEALDRALYATLGFNPCVTLHELRLRMRVGRAFLLLFLYVLVASGAMLLPVGFELAAQHTYSYPARMMQDLGRTALHWLVYTQITLIFLALPAYAASTIAAERERQTLEMLRATLLSPWDVVTGKLLVVLAFGVVLLATTVPLAAWCLMLGGVSPTEVLRVYLMMAATAAWVSALGVLLSAMCQRSLTAIVATYGSLIGVAVVTALGAYVVFAWMSIVSGHTRTQMGPTAAVVLVGIPVVATAWLGALLARWIVQRVPVLRGRWAGRTVLVVAFAVLVVIAGARAGPLVVKMSNAGSGTLLLVNPYLAAASMVEEMVPRSLIDSATPPGTTTPAKDLQGYLCSILLWLYLTVAATLWVLAANVYARQERM